MPKTKMGLFASFYKQNQADETKEIIIPEGQQFFKKNGVIRQLNWVTKRTGG